MVVAAAASVVPAARAADAPAARAPTPASRLDEILARGVLRVGTTGDYKPFTYRVGNGGFIGLDVALAGDLATSLGVKLQLVPTTWGAMMADLGDDRFDLAMGGVSVSLERQKRAWFSTPYLRDGDRKSTRLNSSHI